MKYNHKSYVYISCNKAINEKNESKSNSSGNTFDRLYDNQKKNMVANNLNK